ncbi:MAG: TetR/AcrR family transcriptional regulator [Solirubrobacterales bacterium]
MENKINRFEKKKAATKKRIIETTMELIKLKGFESTTLDQIAIAADIAKKTLYNYYPNKEDIVIDYMQKQIISMAPEVITNLSKLPDTASRIVEATMGTIEWFEKELNIQNLDKFCVYHMLKVLKEKDSRSGYDSILIYILKQGQEAGEIRKDIEAQELADNLEWIHVSIIIGWANNHNINAKEIYTRKVKLFLEGAKG